MDILLINTSNMEYRPIFRETNSLPPLGILYLAAVVKQELGCKCHVIDFVIQDIYKKDLRKILLDNRPPIVGLSTYADSYSQLIEIGTFIKNILPETNIVIGGAFATFRYEELMLKHDFIDYAVRGEGEITFTELTKHILEQKEFKELEKIRGIAFRCGSEIVTTDSRERIDDLNSLPFPDRSLIKDLMINLDYSLPYTISTARGCPGNCIFCSSRYFWGAKVRTRNPESIFQELLEMYDKYEMYSFHITDDTFTARPKVARKVCNFIQEHKLPIKWSCESRADVVTKGLLVDLWEAGCHSIQFGIESSNQNILDAIGKKVTVEQIENAVRMASEMGYKVVGSFILGHYLDTLDTMKATIEFCRKLKDKYRLLPAFALNTPFPGTYQEENAEKLGMKIHTKDYNDLVLCKPHVTTKNFTCEDLQKMFLLACDLL